MRILLTVLLLLPFLSLQAQIGEKDQQINTKEEAFVFKFISGDEAFYGDVFKNDQQLQRLYSLIDSCRSEIENQRIPIYVEGYCTSGTDKETNHQMASTRSNYVKSMLIKYRGLEESNFKTTNRTITREGQTDVVAITLKVPVEEEIVQISVVDIPRITVEDKSKATPPPVNMVSTPETATVKQPETDISTQVVAGGETKREGILSLRANLLYRLANMVNGGIEWKPSNRVGLLLNGGWAGTEWDGGDHKLRAWLVSPEVRVYLGKRYRGFLGAEFHMGKYNLKPKETGFQGNYIGGGLTGGYRARLSRYFDMDFSLGVGYIYTEYNEYYREAGESIQINETLLKKNIIGPTQVGVSLIWKLK